MINNIPKYYIGIDPSLQKTGLAILLITKNKNKIKKAYCVKSNSKDNLINRIVQIRDKIHLLIDQIHNINYCPMVCIEAASHASIGRHDDLGQLRGALNLWLYDNFKCPVLIPPKSLKKYASSHGDASKETMIKTARILKWEIPDNEDDQADAAHLAELAYALDNKDKLQLNRKQLEVINTIKRT